MKTFLQLFERVPADDRLSAGEVLKAEVYREKRAIRVYVKFPELVMPDYIQQVTATVTNAYNLKRFVLVPVYDSALFDGDMMPYLIKWVAKKAPQCATLLAGSCASADGSGELSVTLAGLGADSLDECGCAGIISELVKEQFGIELNVTINEGRSEKELVSQLEKHKEEAVAQREQQEKEAAAQKQKDPVILGREIKGSVVSMSSVDEASGRVIIEGELFAKELGERETRDGKFIITFDITDGETALTCKLFGVEPAQRKLMQERLKKGTCVRVRGLAQYDKYVREVLVMADDINEIPKQIRQDQADEKRVELHLHTKMSAMDALTDVKEVVKRAHQWGHKAVAITDHGVVQSFPDAANAIPKGSDLKIIYGVEAYLVDYGRPIVMNSRGQDITESVVIFDTETTGLSAKNDRIIEIGAVKIQNGEIVDRFSVFVNPERPISAKITELTGISDKMVENEKTIAQILPAFMEFCEGSYLVAHNAEFDIGFMCESAKRLELPFHVTYLDTLELSRALLPQLKKHKLGMVAQHLGVSLEGAHRAVNDAEATAEIFLKFASMLKEKGAKTLDDVNTLFDGEQDPKKLSYRHAIILAKDETGLKNLYTIISASHLKYFYKRPRVPKSLLFKYRDGLIVGSACEQGELYRAVLEKKPYNEIARIAKTYDYFEIQPLGNNEFMIRNNVVADKKELIRLNQRIIELGDYYHKPVVATCDVHFLDPSDAQYRAVLQAGQGYSDADMQAPLYFRTTDEMLEEFDYLSPEKAKEIVIDNPNKIADMCQPIKPVPDGTYPPHIDNAQEDIIAMSQAKARRIYGDPLPEIVQTRMDKELHSITKYGFSVMYLIAQKLVQKSNSDGYIVGSRGSVGSSFVAFLSDITEVNALPPHYVCPQCQHSEFITDGSVACGYDMKDKSCPNCGTKMTKDGHDIPFETFLGFEGDKEPDIDLNFSGVYQPVAHKYVEELFGSENVFKAGTIGTLKDKTVYGFVKNYLEERGKVVTAANVNRLVAGCVGVKRTTGQHPGGLMILPKGLDIHQFCPIQAPADDYSKNIITTHFDYHSISGRLLKLDILGHDDPTMVRMLEDLTGVKVKDIPLDDPQTLSLFTGTEALGVTKDQIDSETGTFAVPEFGTKFVRQMLVETKPTTFSDLVRISGLSHGTDVWNNNAQELVHSQTATLRECICTRDDIMLYLIYHDLPAKSAFTIMEKVRKGKGLTPEDEALMKEHDVPQWYIDSCNKIQYMFPKAHAVAYVTSAVRMGWFKVNYPKEFYATYLTVRADDFDGTYMCDEKKVWAKRHELESAEKLNAKDKSRLTLLELLCELYARGVRLVQVDITKSKVSEFQIVDDGILLPLTAIPGFGPSAAEVMVTEREKEPFSSVEDMRVRGKVGKMTDVFKALGCLDGLPESDQMTFF